MKVKYLGSDGRLRLLVPYLEVRAMPALAFVEVSDCFGRTVIDVGVHIKDRATDEPGTLRCSESCFIADETNDRTALEILAQCMREALRRAYMHELDENIIVAGAMLWEPHGVPQRLPERLPHEQPRPALPAPQPWPIIAAPVPLYSDKLSDSLYQHMLKTTYENINKELLSQLTEGLVRKKRISNRHDRKRARRSK